MGDVYMSGIVCKGSFALGTACRRCSRCLAESKRWQASQAVHSALNTPSSALKEIRELKAKVVELEKELSAPNSNISALCKQLAKVTKERTDAQARILPFKVALKRIAKCKEIDEGDSARSTLEAKIAIAVLAACK
jgi:chromosome segregation ATPase